MKIESGKIAIIRGVSCSRDHCMAYGCDFPNCATPSDEQFDTIEDAKEVYPNITLIT